MPIKTLLVMLFMPIFLLGCGGSGGDTSNDSSGQLGEGVGTAPNVTSKIVNVQNYDFYDVKDYAQVVAYNAYSGVTTEGTLDVYKVRDMFRTLFFDIAANIDAINLDGLNLSANGHNSLNTIKECGASGRVKAQGTPMHFSIDFSSCQISQGGASIIWYISSVYSW